MLSGGSFELRQHFSGRNVMEISWQPDPCQTALSIHETNMGDAYRTVVVRPVCGQV